MSTFTLKKEMQCAQCGRVTVGYAHPDTVFGGSDLDTRPSEHPALATVHRCSQCGYCAYDLSASLQGIADVLASAAYQAQLTGDAAPESIQNHLCAALLHEHVGKDLEAGWLYVNAAWLSDDAGETDRAQACRLQAVDRFEQAIATGVQPSEIPGANALFLSDLLRRAGSFERALAYCDAGLAVVEDNFMRALLRYEKALVAAQDRACHASVEAQSLADG